MDNGSFLAWFICNADAGTTMIFLLLLSHSHDFGDMHWHSRLNTPCWRTKMRSVMQALAPVLLYTKECPVQCNDVVYSAASDKG